MKSRIASATRSGPRRAAPGPEGAEPLRHAEFLGTVPDEPTVVYTFEQPEEDKWVAVIGEET